MKKILILVFVSVFLSWMLPFDPFVQSYYFIYQKIHGFSHIKNFSQGFVPIPKTALSSQMIDEEKLQEKIKLGLPEALNAQIASDLNKYQRIEAEQYLSYLKEPKARQPIHFVIEQGRVRALLGTSDTKACQKLAEEKTIDPTHSYHYYMSCRVLFDVFEYLAEKKYIPDTDFIVELADFIDPDIGQTNAQTAFPIFTFAKDTHNPIENSAILIPDWMNILTRTRIASRIKKANRVFPWEEKKEILFWRGATTDSTGFRTKLVSLSNHHPEKIDAKFADDKANAAHSLPIEAHLAYRYLVSIDGARCSWQRLIWHMQSNSLTFKTESSQIQWFYKGLKPYVHYIPVHNEAQLFEALQFAKENRTLSLSIVQNANTFVEENLSLEAMYHYFIVLLNDYASRKVPDLEF